MSCSNFAQPDDNPGCHLSSLSWLHLRMENSEQLQHPAGWLYSSAREVEVGDTVSVTVSDSLTRRFKIETCEGVGTTRDVFRKFKLAALGS